MKINTIRKINSWDIKPFMSDNIGYVNVKRRQSQVVPSELIDNTYLCGICLDGAQNSVISVGFCGHVFHRSCILECMRRCPTPHMPCPVCRQTYWVQKLYKCGS